MANLSDEYKNYLNEWHKSIIEQYNRDYKSKNILKFEAKQKFDSAMRRLQFFSYDDYRKIILEKTNMHPDNLFENMEYLSTHRPHLDGEQYRFSFPNDYGASIVQFTGSYGHEHGLWELAVLRKGSICYKTPLTKDVIGYLTVEEAMDYLDKIKTL